MIALVLLTLLASEPDIASQPTVAAPVAVSSASPHRLDVGAAFAFGFGSVMAFGGQVQGTYGRKLWDVGVASGTLEAGLLLGYQAAPYSLGSSAFGEARVSGADHLLETWLVVGHGLRLPPSQRVRLSVQLFAGWTESMVRGALKNDALGVSGKSEANVGVLATGIMLQLAVRVTERVSVALRATGPFPYALDVNPWFMADLGLTYQVL